MKVLVTGATGKVGNAVAHALVGRGDDVRVLARSPDSARAVLPDAVDVVQGGFGGEQHRGTWGWERGGRNGRPFGEG